MPAHVDAKEHKRQLRGWLSYAFASEVFVVVSLTLFLPICLEQFARDNGRLLPDRRERCPTTGTVTTSGGEDARCVVKIGWLWIDSASFSLYVYSFSVALQALTVISMGGIADHPPHRKRLLLSFALAGAAAATAFLFLPSSSSLWPLSALLAAIANVSFGASVVAMNAYLPSLAQSSPDVVAAFEALQRGQQHEGSSPASFSIARDERDSEDATSPLLQSSTRPVGTPYEASASSSPLGIEYKARLSAATSRISSQGIATGYGAGIFLLLLTLIPVTLLHGSTFALRLAIGVSGIWWAIGSLPAAWWLPSGDNEVLVTDDSQAWGDHEPPTDGGQWSARREIGKAWYRLGMTLRPSEISKLRNTFKYLAAWFLLSDGFTTITSTAILFAKTSLHMPASSLILIGVLVPTAGILGSLIWPRIQRRFKWSNIRVLITLVILASLIPAYGCIGFLPAFRGEHSRFGGLTTPSEMFVLAVYFGAVYGAFQGYARALYAEMIPPGEEARWYGLFSITDKSSSFLGPLIVGLIADTTGNIRYAFFFLVFMVWAAIPILSAVDVQRGGEDARQYVQRS